MKAYHTDPKFEIPLEDLTPPKSGCHAMKPNNPNPVTCKNPTPYP